VRFGGVPTVDPAEVPPEAAILDVREEDEWEAGHVDGSTHVPLSELPLRARDVPAGGPLVVVCRVGGRSAQVTAWLRQQGREAVNLSGGLEAWQAAGRPLVTDDGGPGTVV
jgi:rhodanese-related sulfurtransferase